MSVYDDQCQTMQVNITKQQLMGFEFQKAIAKGFFYHKTKGYSRVRNQYLFSQVILFC